MPISFRAAPSNTSMQSWRFAHIRASAARVSGQPVNLDDYPRMPYGPSTRQNFRCGEMVFGEGGTADRVSVRCPREVILPDMHALRVLAIEN